MTTNDKSRRRASNGMGSIVQRQNGLWQGQVSYTDHDGSKRRKTTYAKTEDEVVVKMTRLLNDAQAGRIATGPNQSLSTYLDAWLSALERAGRSANTIRSH